jgi:hypothetical protein
MLKGDYIIIKTTQKENIKNNKTHDNYKLCNT